MKHYIFFSIFSLILVALIVNTVVLLGIVTGYIPVELRAIHQTVTYE